MFEILSLKRGLVLAGLVLAGCASAPAPTDPESFDRQATLSLTRELSRDFLFGRAPDTEGSRKAQDLIITRMRALGLQPVGDDYRHPFLYGDFVDRETGQDATPNLPGTNLIARLPGRRKDGLTLVITAHYDHLGVRNGEIFNGADDNASGVAGMLAIADYFAANPPRHDMLFVAFDAEEAGFGGARAFMADPPIPASRMTANLNLDMISRGENGGLWASGANHTPAFAPMLAEIAVEAPIALHMGHDGSDPDEEDWTSMSDQVVFYLKKIPHLYLGVEDHPDYHQPSDDFAKIQPDVFIASVETAIMIAAAMDQDLDEIADFRTENCNLSDC
ncbi:MAG: M28 family peptidase [Hyphomonadaceae bacterium]|nr:M28 family peptidase [Hyphomonadaceae bacterium]